MEYIFGWFGCGLIAGIIGARKNEGCFGFFIGFMLGPIGIIIALLSGGDNIQCPFCKEYVRPDAMVCKHCGKDLKPKTANKKWVDPVEAWDKKQTQEKALPRPVPQEPAKCACPHCETEMDMTGLKPGKYSCPACKGSIEVE